VSYSDNLAQITDEGGCTTQQIFNIDEKAFCWKKQPMRSFIARKEKSMLAMNASDVRPTLVRG
jgi:hypothetical protein